MVIAGSAASLPTPLQGAAFIRFALDVIDLLRQAEPHGLDQGGGPATILHGKSIFPASSFTTLVEGI